jgi:tetratricopeptide (TPR) repeat protein
LIKPEKVNNRMKTQTLRPFFLVGLAFIFTLPLISQKGIEDGSKFGKGEDSINCIRNLSLYKEFFKHNNYKDAIGPWRKVFGECPAARETVYTEGVTMYRSFIESAPEGPVREGLIDTLMLIYDRRTEYFNDEGNVLGRKAIDLLRYRRTEIDAVEDAYGMLKRSIELEQNKTRDAVMITFISASITLNQADKIDDSQAIEDYFMVTGLLDQLVKQSSRWENTKTTIDENILNSGILTCEALNRYYEPIYSQQSNNRAFLDKLIKFYSASGCDRADLYVSASEKLYEIEPGPESAHNLAVLFITKNEYTKALEYLKEAVQGENTDREKKATWYYELAVVSHALASYCDAIRYAREAINLKNDYGKAYILMGDSFIASRENLGAEFEQRTAFWAAADKYSKAASVDASVADEARQRMNSYVAQYPDSEEIFFRDLKDGDSYQVGGCINEYTTVRTGS